MQNTYCSFALFSFRDLFVAGEHMDKDTMSWTRKAISAPVYDNWWQTGRVILDLLTDLVIKIIYLSIKVQRCFPLRYSLFTIFFRQITFGIKLTLFLTKRRHILLRC